MRRLFISLLSLCLLSFTAQAQHLWVYSFNGNVQIRSAAEWKPVELYQKLSPEDSIRFGDNASLSILDRKNDKIYALQKPGTNSVASLIKEASLRSKKQSKSVISYLWNSLRGRNSAEKYRSSAGVVYRDDDVNFALATAVTNSVSALPVDFTLIDPETGSPIEGTAQVGNTAIIRVGNHSSMDLFVNVIDVDAYGNMAPCIPVTSAQIMTQLLIPAYSEVLLDSFPIVFAEPRGEDTLILVACPEWFDIDKVVSALQNSNGTCREVEAGVFKQKLILR